MSNACLILDDEELAKVPVIKKFDTREWLPDTIASTRPFDKGFIKTSFPKVFRSRLYSNEAKSVSDMSANSNLSTLSLLEKVKGVLSASEVIPPEAARSEAARFEAVPLDKEEKAAGPYEPMTPPYHD